MEEYAYKTFLYEQLGGGEKCKNAENALHNFSTHTHTQARVYNIVCVYLIMLVCVCVYACAYVCVR